MHPKAVSEARSHTKTVPDRINNVLVLFRLIFVGSPCPSNLCFMADIMSDTIIGHLDNNDWDKNILRSDFVNNVPEC